jgi:hypothetical protein
LGAVNHRFIFYLLGLFFGSQHSSHGNEIFERNFQQNEVIIRNTNIILELAVGEIENDIQKSDFGWFGHVM